MQGMATENIVIAVLASVGVVVLIVMFVYVLKQLFGQKGE